MVTSKPSGLATLKMGIVIPRDQCVSTVAPSPPLRFRFALQSSRGNRAINGVSLWQSRRIAGKTAEKLEPTSPSPRLHGKAFFITSVVIRFVVLDS